MFVIKAYASTGQWITIKGVHILVGGDGNIIKGPTKLIGSTVQSLRGSSSKRHRGRRPTRTMSDYYRRNAPAFGAPVYINPSDSRSGSGSTPPRTMGDYYRKYSHIFGAPVTHQRGRGKK